MSDLLPLVVAALRDKVSVDAQEEITQLRKDRNISHAVQVIRSKDDGDDENEDDDVIVYASGHFDDGCYSDNTNLFEVNMEQDAQNTCRLADLRYCHIVVGGGFPFATLSNTTRNGQYFEGWLTTQDLADENDENVVGVDICFCPYSTWLKLIIRNWPKASFTAKIQADDLEAADITYYLVETVAREYPEATVEFTSVAFVAKHIHGALKRLLPARRREEVRADRDGRMAQINPAYNELLDFVALAMRQAGNDAGPELFQPQLFAVMRCISDIGVSQLANNHNVITMVVSVYALRGQMGLDLIPEIVRQHFPHLSSTQANNLGNDGNNEDLEE